MHIRSLEDTPSLSLVLDMQRAMSQAQNEGELVYGFSQRFHEIAGVSEILDLAVVPGDQRAFRIMDRMDLAKGCDSPLSIRANCRWDEPPDSVPVTRGGLIGKFIERLSFETETQYKNIVTIAGVTLVIGFTVFANFMAFGFLVGFKVLIVPEIIMFIIFLIALAMKLNNLLKNNYEVVKEDEEGLFLRYNFN